MALTPLTGVQQATILALVEARRLDVVPTDVARATSFLRQAEERLDQLPLLTSVAVRYGIAYDACHDVGEALMAAYGFRTTSGPGQHEALGRYLRAVFDKPPVARAAREFDRLRRARNQDRYEAKRWAPRRPRRPSRSPARCSTPPSPEAFRRNPAVRKRSARSSAGPILADDGQRYRGCVFA